MTISKMKDLKSLWSRRDFLSTVSLACAGTAMMLHPMAAWAIEDIDPRVAKIVADTIGVDTHNHIDVPLETAGLPGPKIDLAGEMKRSGLSVICMTFATDYQKGNAYDRFLNGLTALDEQLKINGLKRALTLSDLNKAHKKRQPAVIQAVEGAHFLDGHLDRLSTAYNRGLRLLTLLHDSDANVPLGDVFTNPVRYGGLTTFGADVIRECNRLGILADLSHANVETVTAALKVTSHPLVVSHTGLDSRPGNNADMARMMKPRLISKEHAKYVAGTGSIIGVWTHLADSSLEYAHNIRAMVDVVGIDHVCIGTDTKLTPAYHPPGDKHGGPGGKMGGGSNEIWSDQKLGFYYTVVDALLKTGFNADEIGKIGGGNFCRVFDAATKGHH
ncbi:MAG: membrane dipeptidase [Pedobacter sp.]|uniref:dipeptidase n=1 Tax=Pedobacter sp. TaxID=1411316 RepID=UPI0033974ED0